MDVKLFRKVSAERYLRNALVNMVEETSGMEATGKANVVEGLSAQEVSQGDTQEVVHGDIQEVDQGNIQEFGHGYIQEFDRGDIYILVGEVIAAEGHEEQQAALASLDRFSDRNPGQLSSFCSSDVLEAMTDPLLDIDTASVTALLSLLLTKLPPSCPSLSSLQATLRETLPRHLASPHSSLLSTAVAVVELYCGHPALLPHNAEDAAALAVTMLGLLALLPLPEGVLPEDLAARQVKLS